jgi:hypothetical protein
MSNIANQLSSTCNLCNEVVGQSVANRHLTNCLPKHLENSSSKKKRVESYLIRIFSTAHFYQPFRPKQFWLYVHAPAKLRLETLDDFLRNLWLECCGHLSQVKLRKLGAVSPNQEPHTNINMPDCRANRFSNGQKAWTRRQELRFKGKFLAHFSNDCVAWMLIWIDVPATGQPQAGFDVVPK